MDPENQRILEEHIRQQNIDESLNTGKVKASVVVQQGAFCPTGLIYYLVFDTVPSRTSICIENRCDLFRAAFCFQTVYQFDILGDIYYPAGQVLTLKKAMENSPELFGTVIMLYINCSVNGVPVKGKKRLTLADK